MHQYRSWSTKRRYRQIFNIGPIIGVRQYRSLLTTISISEASIQKLHIVLDIDVINQNVDIQTEISWCRYRHIRASGTKRRYRRHGKVPNGARQWAWGGVQRDKWVGNLGLQSSVGWKVQSESVLTRRQPLVWPSLAVIPDAETGHWTRGCWSVLEGTGPVHMDEPPPPCDAANLPKSDSV